MFIFPLIYITSFIIAFREVLKGNRAGLFIYMIFGLSIYTTAMSVTFILGLKDLIPFFQSFKEFLVITVLVLNIISLKYRPRFHVIDYVIFAFLLYTILYAILPIGEQNFGQRLIALKSTSFFMVVYFVGRLFDPRTIYISKYFNYLMLLTIAAGAVVIIEFLMNQHLQTITGYADYSYYFFNSEPSGSYGLTTTFESEGGYKRFGSFFANPLEHAAATLIALCVLAALYTTDENKLKINNIGILAFSASFISIFLALSRSPLASYFLIIYVYSRITKKKQITNAFHAGIGILALYLVYLFSKFESNNTGIVEVLMNTIDFSNPSSVGHLVEWVQGVMAMIEHPLGLGLGSSGRVGGTLGENVGGENQFIIIGVQVGIIALTLYIAAYIMFIKTALKWLNKLKGKERKVCMAVLLLKIGLFIPLFTSEVEGSSYISYLSWFLSGLFVSIIMLPKTVSIPAENAY